MRGSAESFRAGTTLAVRNVIESCLQHKIERLIYVSSMGVMQHAGRPAGQVMREDSQYEQRPELRGLYTQTKLDAERAVLDAIDSRDLPAVVIRPGQIFGPGAEAVPPNGVIALAGRWILVGTGKLPLPLVFVDDVVDALLLAGAGEDAPGKTFNIVDTSLVTQNEYIDACRPALVGKAKMMRLPTWFMLSAAWGVELLGKLLRRDVPLSRYRVRSLHPLSNFDVSAANDVLHWEPRVGSKVGLLRTFSSQDGKVRD
jgi:nucleoside-diphosphate-sugar epimerase